MSLQMSRAMLGPALVIGGCGFISVISRNPHQNRREGVSYYIGDICSEVEIQQLLDTIKPRAVFHAAAPRADDPSVVPADHHSITVEGTKTVLKCVRNCPTVKALVYTSTCAVSRGYQHYNIDETALLWEQDSKTIPYFKAKALADKLVCEANERPDSEGRGVLTATLRLPWVYGERDNQAIPGMLKTAEAGQTRIQLGHNQNLVEPTYVGNCALAHILAAKKLLESENCSLALKVDGEAFNITDGDPQPFWTFSRMIWHIAGDKTTPDQVSIVPGWLALSMAHTVDWAYYLLTLGKLRPPLNISPLYIQYTIYNATYDISKARKRLDYSPVVDKEKHLKSSIAWEFEHHGDKYKNLGQSTVAKDTMP